MAVVINGTTGITSVNGTAGAPSVTGTDTDTGIVYGTNTLSLATGGTTAVTVDSSQNVGIGTSSPGYKLDVKGAIGFGSTTIGEIGGSGGNPYIGSVGALPFNIFTNGSERMRIDSSGNVGIGTSSPSSFSTYRYLDLVGGGTSTGGVFQSKTSNGAVVNTLYTTGSAGAIGTGTNHPLQFLTNDTVRATIDTSGTLLVGTTSASGFPFASPKMYLNNSGYNGIGVQNVGNGYIAFTTSPSANHSYFAGYYLNSSGTAVGSISVTSSSTTYGTSSDYRLKDNIAPMTDALATVGRLKPVTYTWKVDGSDGQGFIAHELQEVVPDAVIGQKDAVDAEGNPVYQGIDTSFLVATLTAAIQEQQAIIEQLRADVAALKAKA